MLIKLTEEQIKDSLDKRKIIVNRYLQDKSTFIKGLTKVQRYFSQNAPNGDGYPIFLIPYSDDLKSLFSFMVKCRKDSYCCDGCWERNECLRKCTKKLLLSLTKRNRKNISFNELFSNNRYSMNIYNKQAIELIETIIFNLGLTDD